MKKLYIVGLGPGDGEFITLQARKALEDSQVICGYTVYIDLIAESCQGKEILTTPMTRELERCRMALERAADGQTTAMVCSGDAGVYGMAGPILELSPEYPQVEIEVVPGITAALSGGAVLGAPLTHDFAIISLSDLLTPWETIEKRLRCAAEGDFAIAIYNPASHGRPDHLKRACDILLRVLPEERLCGIVRNIGREGQSSRILTLGELQAADVDMFSTVFVGNSSTKVVNGALITPRGYRNV